MQSIPVSTCRFTVSAIAGVTWAAMTAGSVISALASRPGVSSQPLGAGSRPTCEVLIRVVLRCMVLSSPAPVCDPAHDNTMGISLSNRLQLRSQSEAGDCGVCRALEPVTRRINGTSRRLERSFDWGPAIEAHLSHRRQVGTAVSDPSAYRASMARQPPVQRLRRTCSRWLFDDEGRRESHGLGQVVEIGRCRHHHLVNLGKLLLGTVALDPHRVAQAAVASLYGRIDTEESAQVDFAFGLDGEALESDAAHRTLRHIPDHHAGIERRDQVFLRIGILVRAAELARFIDVDREAARHLIAAHAKALDLRTAVRLALPGRDDMPLGLALSGIPLDPLNQGKQVVDIDAVDDIRRNGHCVTIHDKSPHSCSVIETESDRFSAMWRAPPEYARSEERRV